MRHLLAVSWAMPPRLAPRALQVARLIEGLRNHDWITTVVCARPEASELPGGFDVELGLRYRDSVRTLAIETDEEREPSSAWVAWLRSMNPPDSLREANWERRAGRAVRQVLAERGADAFVTFAQPWNDHRIGLRVKRRHPSLPWIAHFSDPWVDSPYYADLDPERLGYWMAEERRVIAKADVVVFVSRETEALVTGKYPAAWRKKTRVVPHAFDPSLRPAVSPPAGAGGPLTLVHTGSLYHGRRSPAGLLAALRRIADECDGAPEIRVEFIGSPAPEVERMAREAGVEKLVSFRGPIEYRPALEAAARADALLVIDAPAERSVFLPSKLMDYVMLDRPILGLTPRTGSTAELLRELGHPVVEPGDVSAIAEVLRGWIVASRRGPLTPGPAHFAARDRYASPAVSGVFAEVLDFACRSCRAES